MQASERTPHQQGLVTLQSLFLQFSNLFSLGTCEHAWSVFLATGSRAQTLVAHVGSRFLSTALSCYAMGQTLLVLLNAY